MSDTAKDDSDTLTLAALPVPAQQSQSNGQRNPLAGLERALKAANATPFTATEVIDIEGLISAFPKTTPPANAVQKFESAILACPEHWRIVRSQLSYQSDETRGSAEKSDCECPGCAPLCALTIAAHNARLED